MLGDTSVGKTSLVSRYCEDKFDEQALTTVGLSFSKALHKFKDGGTINVKVWDTAG